MEISKFIIAMKDFAEDITYGEMKRIAERGTLLDQAEEQFKEVARVLNDIKVLKRERISGEKLQNDRI